jgi:hypothetical protein
VFLTFGRRKSRRYAAACDALVTYSVLPPDLRAFYDSVAKNVDTIAA